VRGQSDSFGNDWLPLLQQRVDIFNNILINVLGTVEYVVEILVHVWHTRCSQRNEMVQFLKCHRVICTTTDD